MSLGRRFQRRWRTLAFGSVTSPKGQRGNSDRRYQPEGPAREFRTPLAGAVRWCFLHLRPSGQPFRGLRPRSSKSERVTTKPGKTAPPSSD